MRTLLCQIDEDRQFQYQQHQPSVGEPAPLASRGRARHRVPSRTQSHRQRVPGGPNPAGWLSRGVARREAWNGVAILARWAPVVTRTDLPGDISDGQCRYLEAAVKGVLVASIYAPNGNPQPGPKFEYKLAWLKRLNAHAAELYATGAPVVLAGDYNVVPTDLDIYSTKSWDRDALLQPESRAAYQRLLAQGWADAIRALHPKEPVYTFWDYMRNCWERDGGLRLDHVLLSPVLKERLQGAGVDRHIRGLEDASDHAPVWAEFTMRATGRDPRALWRPRDDNGGDSFAER